MTRVSARRKAGCPRLGVSATVPRAPASRCFRAASGIASRTPRSSRTRSASAKVVGSGTVGPEAIVDRSSPTTSERTRATTRAGAAARARPPPLSRERCLRTVLSSAMEAPARSRCAVTAAFSSRVTPSAGAGSRAEAPPERRSTSVSSLPRPCARASTARAAARPRASGSGWPARRRRVRARARSRPRALRSSARPGPLPPPPPSWGRPCPPPPRRGGRVRGDAPFPPPSAARPAGAALRARGARDRPRAGRRRGWRRRPGAGAPA